jgi:CRISPR system Cascade subunit CasB
MGLLDKAQVGSASRRFMQLLGRDGSTLPHHLRQAIQLLSSHEIPVHYGQLLDDLVVLLGPSRAGEPAARVRLRWAREFYMPATIEPSDPSDPTDESHSVERRRDDS